MSTPTLEQVRDLLASYLDDRGCHIEAENVRKGIDLESYENELKLVGWMYRHAHLAKPAQAVDVGAIREVIKRLEEHPLSDEWKVFDQCADKLTRAISGEKAGRVDGWQPIETAPKDGTAIIVCTLGRQIDIATWDGKVWKDYAYGESCGASHWQPLPASPAPDKECQS